MMTSPALELVKEIIEKVGPRQAGSEAEKRGQNLISEKLGDFCSSVERQPFRVALGAKFGSLRLFCILFAVAVFLVFFDFRAALLLSATNAILFFLHFNSYRHILDFLFPLQSSSNVIGTIEPQEEAKRTLVFSGHMDSTPEFIWWYKMKDWGVRMMIFVGVGFVFLPLFLLICILSGNDEITRNFIYIHSFFMLCIPLSAVFFFIHGKKVVDGAQDNLSGIAVAFEAARALTENGQSILKHTRIKMVSFGSEETGLRGSHAYVKRNFQEFKDQNSTLINLDGILEKENLYIITTEPSPMIRYKKEIVKELADAFKACDIESKLGAIPVGATDGASFARKKLNAVTVVGLPLNGLHPTYHTRLDTHHYLDGETLELMKNILIQFTLEADRKLGED